MNKVAPEEANEDLLLNYTCNINDSHKLVEQGPHSSGRVSLHDSSEYDDEELEEELEELMIGQVFSEPKREKWSNKWDFILAIIGYAVGYGVIYRFPYLCLKHGGGSFLIPYVIFWILFGVPVFYMELIMGQYTRQGNISAWKLVPIFKGIGFCSMFVSYLVSFYYNVVMAWSLIYVKDSVSGGLAWANCDNDWNTRKTCHELALDSEPESLPNGYLTAGTDYWQAKVLRIHTSNWEDQDKSSRSNYYYGDEKAVKYFNFDHPGGLNLDTALFQLCISLVLLFVLLKGIRITGKVVWFTAIMPYLLMTLLLYRGMSLPGAVEGIKFFLMPDLDNLLKVPIWVDAVTQVFFSSGVGFGAHLTYASYNSFNHNIFRDCIFASLLTSITSIFAGFVVFAFLGNLAYLLNSDITNVLTAKGPDIIYRVYPDVIQGFGGANFYSLLFFMMLILLGIDSTIGAMENVITGLCDEFKGFFFKHKQMRAILCFILIFASYLISLTNATRAGIYFFIFWDHYAVGSSLIFTVMIQSIAMAWLFGLKELCDVAEVMTGYRPNFFFRITWKFINPVLLSIIFIFTIVLEESPDYDGKVSFNSIKYWGLSIAILPVVIIVPMFAIIQMLKTNGPLKLRFLIAISPENEHKQIMKTGSGKRYTKAHWLYIGGLFNTYSALRDLEEKLRLEELENALI